ncbi:FHF complex subunit HOOK-interacting protein 1A [Triplophysa dalaica]|uniref:FHF complex subunit HOOK-interacting protein 1A n=1 Tax=Triplophysa dalaica TaxID=1582913 RepID=UPI0024DF38AA|nr:FHF complex subunit HOOK-interacting protein 1A [Triplophysa dalaica]XP_056627551.1 FHF complex subunit HOOK-interacting protein 1A [Triplophysa dalaica]XP_056627560.1 FHF complex subunit HOOK-interacting protein 1A [Triplophysa dalaica]
MAFMVANGNQGGQTLVLKDVDPETCMIVFRNHWAQVVKILEKHDPVRSNVGILGVGHGLGGGGGLGGLRFGQIPGDEASAVQNYVEHMLILLMEEECGQSGAMGPILEFVVMENVLERLFIWSLRREFTDEMKLEQLKMYEMLIGQARQPLLHHKPILKPLMMLLSSCSGSPSRPSSAVVEAELVLLLNQLCSVLTKDPSVLELFFHTSEDQGAANFLIFSLLIPFIHREGSVGQQARDALLLIMALSAENHVVAKHIAENTYFCPVLATGLSGLYSSLPTKLDVPNEDWHCLSGEDWQQLPSLVQFLNSLEFCNAVIQVAHLSIRDQLVEYIHNGFLVPVLAPALHKLTLEEVMTTTAYLDLFIRIVSEPALLRTFLSFIFLHRHDNVHILDTLVSRINTPFQLGTVSLALFRTLIGLYCEDVMLQLIFKYLISCNHMMLSQRRVLRERDCYSVSAAKFLSLTPSCCSPEIVPPPLRHLDSILWSKGTDGSQKGTEESEEVLPEEDDCVIGSEIHLDVSYVQYLSDAENNIANCMRACRVWSAPYDGENPPPEEYQSSTLEESGRTRPQITSKTTQPQNQVQQSSQPVRDHNAAPGLLELEWDDSYDACPTQPHPEEGQDAGPIQDEPPQHIQEMRRTAIMLVKGSYMEEAEFQNDVMVYDLVAQKDVQDSSNSCHASSKPAESEQLESGEPTSNQNPTESSIRNGPSMEDCKKKEGEPAQSDRSAIPEGEDLMAQYEDLIRSLAAQSSSQTNSELKSPTELMEDEVEFNSFLPETPELERMPSSPFGTKPCSASRGNAVPFTGPFVSVLLSRLENMLNNTLQVNLLLTGILAQLAAYPQPLLRSFLLNTNMVFQPSVRSLYQVLASLKNQIEQLSATRKDFPELLTAAQQCLLARESSLRDSQSPKMGDRIHGPEADKTKKYPAIQPKVIVPSNRTEVYATVLFTEFLKELAAIAQEHSILSQLPMEE